MNSKNIVVGIDFGQSCSGYSYGYSQDISQTIYCPEIWDASCLSKTLTQIVFDENKKLIAFGYEARDYFSNNEEGTEKHSLYSRFKMRLFDPENRGQSIKSDCVFEREIKWVVTIPAIWDDASIQVMRNCAETAGLCSKDDRDSLVFCYEPEAGAFNCIYEKTAAYSVNVDIIVYEQLYDAKLKNISKFGAFGSTKVNDNFCSFLKKVFGDEIFGLNPKIVSIRKQPKSYATEIMEKVTSTKPHTGKSKIKIRDVEYCQNICDVFVYANQMVDPGVQFIGELYVTIPNVGAPVEENCIEVSFKFSLAEIEVKAKHVKSGKETLISYCFALDEAESIRRNKLRQEKNKLPKVQLCIMLDCTGSMGPWIKESKEKIIKLTELLEKYYVGLELNVSFIGYRDIGEVDRFEIFPFTTNLGYLSSQINLVVPHGGGDIPEDIAGTLLQVNNLLWKPDYTKLVVHIGDAPCHGKKYHRFTDSYPDGDPSGLIPEKLLGTLSSKSIDYYFIKITSDTDTMIDVFRKSYDSPQKKIVVCELGSDVSKLLPSLVNFVQTSITRLSK
ncbi:hypothetical protein ACTFIU_008849 [Dictyostelium citrinum]